MPKRDRRIAALTSELVEKTEAHAQSAALASRDDAALFTVDVQPRGAKRSRTVPQLRAGSAEDDEAAIASALAVVSRAKYMLPKVLAPLPAVSKVAARAHSESTQLHAARSTEAVRRPPASVYRDSAASVITERAAMGARAPVADLAGLKNARAELRDLWADDCEAGGGGAAAAAAEVEANTHARDTLRAMVPRRTLQNIEPRLRPASGPLKRVIAVVPAAGASYNPEVGDHQAALKAAVEAETRAQNASQRRRVAIEEQPPTKAYLALLDAGARRFAAADEADVDGIGGTGTSTVVAGGARDGDAMDVDEGEGGGSRQPPKRALKLDRVARLAAAKERKLRARAERKGAVEKSLAELDDIAARKSAAAGVRPPRSAAAWALAARARDALAVAPSLMDIPLSSELTGSLRTIKPITSGMLLLSTMPALVHRGDVGKRKRIPQVSIVEKDGKVEAVVNSAGAVRKSTGRRRPWKDVEFPRRRNFQPAEDIVRDAQARGIIKGTVEGVLPDFAKARALKIKIEKEKTTNGALSIA